MLTCRLMLAFVGLLAGLACNSELEPVRPCTRFSAPSRIEITAADPVELPCVPQSLDGDGVIDCEVFELLPEPGQPAALSECTELPGRELVEIVAREGEGPRQLCRVTEVLRADIATEAGWYSASCDVTGQRIAFTGVTPRATGSEIRVDCTIDRIGGIDAVCDGDEAGGCENGQLCPPADDLCATGHALPDPSSARLVCDVVGRTCAVPCTDDSSCTAVGLTDYVCDLRTNGDAAGEDADQLPTAQRALARHVCVNPTCAW